MIRGFGLLCKVNFNQISTLDVFFHCMNIIKIHDFACPRCGARHPSWRKHDTYNRYLVGFEKSAVVCSAISVTRFMCQSCGSTHAVLPEFLIPFKSHSLFFVLAVMKDLFGGSTTVARLCTKYEISASTLYAWKKLFLKDKKLWLGILKDILTSTDEFLSFLLSKGLEQCLHEFFAITNRSFLQTCSNPPRNGTFTPD